MIKMILKCLKIITIKKKKLNKLNNKILIFNLRNLLLISSLEPLRINSEKYFTKMSKIIPEIIILIVIKKFK